MSDQEVLFPLDGLARLTEELSAERAIVTNVRHSHYGFSMVEFSYKDCGHFVVLITDDLDLDAADRVCAEVPLRWDPSINSAYFY
jgi:hypothetical protein